jgi:hypothetical protein
MVTTRVKPRGSFYACKHARTHSRVFVDIRAGIPAEDDGCYLALDSVTYQASWQTIAVTAALVLKPYTYFTNHP